VKLCTDCRHCELTPNPEFSKCNAPQNMVTSPVDGAQTRQIQYCSTLRGYEQSHLCGIGAKWFEARHAAEEHGAYADEARQDEYWRQEFARRRAETERPR